MFYALSKSMDLLFAPAFWAALAAACTVWFVRAGHTRRALNASIFTLGCVYLPATGLVSHYLFEYVEAYAAPRIQKGKVYDAAVVLGGFAHTGPFGEIELSEGADRLLRALELLKRGRVRKIVITAGTEARPAEADLAAQILMEAGIARDRIVLGQKSRNTRQNALEAKELLTRERLASSVLITSAFHMQRAYECFRAVGLTPDVLATDHQAPPLSGLFSALAPRAQQYAQTELALRELSGRVIYRWRGFAKR